MTLSRILCLLNLIYICITLSFECPGDESQCTPHKYRHDIDECTYVESCCDALIDDDALINYLNIHYCNKWLNQYYIGIIIWCILCIYMFLFLNKVADDYFAPILTALSEELGLSPEFSGVTFLAIGNGADDISSAVYAIRTGGNVTKLAFGNLLGVTVLNLTFINGILAYVYYKHQANGTYAKVDMIPFLRDLLFLLIIIILMFVIIIKNKINLFESLLFLIIYIIYVIIVCVQERYNQKSKQKQTVNIHGGSISLHEIQTTQIDDQPQHIPENDQQIAEIEDKEKHKDTDSVSSDSSSDSLQIVDWDKLQHQNIHKYRILRGLYLVLSFPVFVINILCILTIPSTSIKYWNDYIALLSCLSAPIWFMFGFGLMDVEIAIVDIPIFVFVIILAFITMIFVAYKIYKIRKNNSERNVIVYKRYFLFLGFLSSFAWIGFIADQLVTILTTLGVISTIDLTILGITLLTWGNSIEDVIADSSVVKRGYIKMAIAASISAPTVNIAFSIGIGTLIKCVKNDNHMFYIPSDANLYLSSISAMVQILITVIIAVLCQWQLKKIFMVWSFGFYIVFIIATVVVYTVM
eukprot:9774_1